MHPVTIVAATDLSRSALEAARRAALIARDHAARLELLHVIAHPFISDSWNVARLGLHLDERPFRELARRQLEEQARELADETGIAPALHLAEGKPFVEIGARAHALAADLLVVGAHGENLIRDAFLGTTAHHVLGIAPVPLLLVKQPVHGAYRRAVLATDFSADSAEAARCARRLFTRLDIRLFHAYDVAFEGKLNYAGVPRELVERYRVLANADARKQLEAFARANDLGAAVHALVHGSAPLRIREYAGEVGADLIVAGAQGKGALEQALLGSVSLRLVTEAPCDVLLARAHRR